MLSPAQILVSRGSDRIRLPVILKTAYATAEGNLRNRFLADLRNPFVVRRLQEPPSASMLARSALFAARHRA
jgi:hypothetical protein